MTAATAAVTAAGGADATLLRVAQEHLQGIELSDSSLKRSLPRVAKDPRETARIADALQEVPSFVGDTVLDPFLGTGTTSVAAALWGRSSVGVEVDPEYLQMARARFLARTSDLFARQCLDVVA